MLPVQVADGAARRLRLAVLAEHPDGELRRRPAVQRLRTQRRSSASSVVSVILGFVVVEPRLRRLLPRDRERVPRRANGLAVVARLRAEAPALDHVDLVPLELARRARAHRVRHPRHLPLDGLRRRGAGAAHRRRPRLEGARPVARARQGLLVARVRRRPRSAISCRASSVVRSPARWSAVSTVQSGQATFVGIVVSIVAGTLSSLVTTPFVAAFVTVLYFDLRVRKEAFDLQLLAQRIGVDPPAGALLGPAAPLAGRTPGTSRRSGRRLRGGSLAAAKTREARARRGGVRTAAGCACVRQRRAEQVQALAKQAATSPSALARLRSIRSVDGRAFDLSAAPADVRPGRELKRAAARRSPARSARPRPVRRAGGGPSRPARAALPRQRGPAPVPRRAGLARRQVLGR